MSDRSDEIARQYIEALKVMAVNIAANTGRPVAEVIPEAANRTDQMYTGVIAMLAAISGEDPGIFLSEIKAKAARMDGGELLLAAMPAQKDVN